MEMNNGNTTIPAHFNGECVLLDKPYNLEPYAKRLVVVISTTTTEREDWLRLSHRRLEEAYGDDEPDYTLDALRTVNAKYERR
jgi:hypothetical protein